jgi:ADP-ribose pyrophosphatase YjhB (NUDIX family)
VTPEPAAEAVERWLAWVRRLTAIAQNGLTFAANHFDRERYEELRAIAAAMLAQIGDAPIERVLGLLAGESGYMTPKVDVRGLIFEGDRVLLVREILDGHWTAPGGWADPGDTPSAAVLREIREESGYDARILKLAAVYDRTRQGHTPPLPFAVYKLFFLCERTGGAARLSDETDGVDFFPIDSLPPLSLGRITLAQILRLHQHHLHLDWPADFD